MQHQWRLGGYVGLVALLASCGGGGAPSSGVEPDVVVRPAYIVDEFDPSEPGEPLQAAQWHLWEHGVNVPPYGLNFENTGKGMVVAMLDTSIQITHPELLGRIAAYADFVDAADQDPSPDPTSTTAWHGTAVAGTIAAAARGPNYHGTGEGGRGVAPLVQLLAFRVVPEATGEVSAPPSLALQKAIDEGARVVNNSWTHKDGGALTPVDSAWRDTLGRIMLNSPPPVVIFAAGNAGEGSDATAVPLMGDMSSWDTYTNHRQVITIGATGSQGEAVEYSESGPNVLVSAPGGTRGDGLITTDLIGAGGANPFGDDLKADSGGTGFAGTSGAAAVASGVVALMLQAKPTLGAREVAWILADTATAPSCVRPVCDGWLAPQAAEMGWAKTYSHRYGFGRINATAAVEMAKAFEPFGAEQSCDSAWVYPNVTGYSGVRIPEVATNGVVSFFEQSKVMSACPSRIERVSLEVEVSANTTYSQNRFSGDLHIRLSSPSGRISELTRPHACRKACADLTNGFTFSSARHMGEPGDGSWTLSIADELPNDQGTLNRWRLRLYGH